MSPRQPANGEPLVSVVLPIFNRRKFLPSAFSAIRDQQIPSLEVIVIDDGSADDSRTVVEELAASFPHAVRYIAQDNQGPYGARNRGVAESSGRYVAFYDSDDVWLPHHLPACLEALEQNSEVDWVYAACELVDLDSQRTLEASSFYEGGRARPFMSLRHYARGELQVITDPGAVRCQIDHGLFCGLQNSVLRRSVFERLTFEAATRNEAEDQLFAIRALAAGLHLAYFDRVHVRYQVHSENSSGTSQGMSLAKRRKVYEPLVAGYERLALEIPLSASERRSLRRRVGHDLFWHLGYNGYWTAGQRAEALRTFSRALRSWPWAPAQWKTYLLAVLRTTLGLGATLPKGAA